MLDKYPHEKKCHDRKLYVFLNWNKLFLFLNFLNKLKLIFIPYLSFIPIFIYLSRIYLHQNVTKKQYFIIQIIIK